LTTNSQYFTGVEVGCRFNGLRHTTPEAPFTGTISAKFYKISPDQSRSLLAEWSGECEAGVPCDIGEGNTFDYGTPWSGVAFDWVYFYAAGCYAIDTVVEFVSDDDQTPLRESYENRMAIHVLDPLFPDDQQPYRVVIYDKRYSEDCVYSQGMYTLRIEPIKGPFASLAHAQDVYNRYSAIINEYAAHCVCQTRNEPPCWSSHIPAGSMFLTGNYAYWDAGEEKWFVEAHGGEGGGEARICCSEFVEYFGVGWIDHEDYTITPHLYDSSTGESLGDFGGGNGVLRPCECLYFTVSFNIEVSREDGYYFDGSPIYGYAGLYEWSKCLICRTNDPDWQKEEPKCIWHLQDWSGGKSDWYWNSIYFTGVPENEWHYQELIAHEAEE
jgi:hypothetical protein